MVGTRNNTVTLVQAWHMQRAMAAIGKHRRKLLERADKPTPRLTAQQRDERYRKQNGGNRLTPRQCARLAKKTRRALHLHAIDEAAA